jgi:predicted dehydrogenase
MPGNSNIRFGVVGIHGFSRSHIGSLQRLEASGAPVKLAAAMAHARRQDEAYASSLEAAGVKLAPDLDALLAMKSELDIVTLPVGIALHVPLAEKILQAGYPVYLEKPVTGAIQDFDRLADAERRAPGPLFVGFQDIFQPSLWELKRRLLDGELGRLRRAVVMAAWPRANSYYARNAWAGRLAIDGTWVLDSPLNNACAHYLNLLLFLAGAGPTAAACPLEVTAELYRANPIESADTVAVRIRTAEGVEVVFIVSHACENSRGPVFRLECAKGEATSERNGGADADWHLRRKPAGAKSSGEDMSEQVDRIPVLSAWVDPFQQVAGILQGKKGLPACSLAMARPHCLAVNGAHLSSPIRGVPAALCFDVTRTQHDGEVHTYRVVKGMNDCLNACLENGCLPSESGAAGWARPGKQVDVSQLTCFDLPK